MRHFILATFIILVGLCSCKKKGCTDSLALNYSESAEKSDGSCVYPTNVRIISVELYFDSINNETGLTWDESSFADTRITVYRLDQAPFNNNPMFSFLSDTIFENSLGNHFVNLPQYVVMSGITTTEDVAIFIYATELDGEEGEDMGGFSFVPFMYAVDSRVEGYSDKYPESLMLVDEVRGTFVVLELEWF